MSLIRQLLCYKMQLAPRPAMQIALRRCQFFQKSADIWPHFPWHKLSLKKQFGLTAKRRLDSK